MPFRVREILLVSSAYDAFVLEEDGSLSDRLFYEYSELSLSWAPRLTHAATLDEALAVLAERRIDLVITVVRVGDVDAGQLSRAIKGLHRDIPVVLLIFDEADLSLWPEARTHSEGIDSTFLWTGSAGVLIAAIKSIEDQKNALHDTATAGVQVILVVEDRVRAYSRFLALLYAELLTQSGSLIAEGLNDFHRLMRMRARPKILLASSFEEGVAVYQAFSSHICALMSDVRLPRQGEQAPDAGLELAQLIRRSDPDLPILFQTAEAEAESRASELGATFLRKHAKDFRAQVRRFLEESLGFGDFVFRLPDRTEVGRARDVFEMEQVLARVPVASVAFHAHHNHFSTWLTARSLYQLAERVRSWRPPDYADPEELRADLIAALETARVIQQEGVITDLHSRNTGPENRFVRVGRGSVGGKGRGVAFMSTLIVRHGLLERFDGLQIRIPKTVVIGTDVFEELVESVADSHELEGVSDEAIVARMVTGNFDESLLRDLWRAFSNLKGPLAVRSSSVLEDSRFQPFAGVYATFMLPNNHADENVRFQELLRAIKAVYASAFFAEAQHYLAGTPHDADDQKMAVVIQQVVGQAHGDRYYPTISGVAQSYNYYPIGGQRADDGVVQLALGLGQTVVSGEVALRVSPAAPTILPQFPSASAFFAGSQRHFYAIDLSQPQLDVAKAPEDLLVRCDLAAAEEDGVLDLVGSVYSAEDDVIRENLRARGPRIVTFNNILKWNSLPLAPAIGELCRLLREAIGEEVEIEFAVDVPTPGSRRGARLYLLQVRPMTSPDQRNLGADLDAVPEADVVARTDVALGHGRHDDIYDVVFVSAESLDAKRGRALAERVAAIDRELRGAGRPYALIGPGRWGSSDPTLGIGVSWAQISGAQIIVETPLGGRRIEPSQGTHFFRNITAARVAYLTITDTQRSWLDRAWLGVEKAGDAGEVTHVQLEHPVTVHVDGRRGAAAIVRTQRLSLPGGDVISRA